MKINNELRDQLESFLEQKGGGHLLAEFKKQKRSPAWSEWRKWHMGLFASLCSWGVVAAASWLLFTQIEDGIVYNRFVRQKITEARINSLNSFKQSVNDYFESTVSIIDRDSVTRAEKNENFNLERKMFADINDLKLLYVGKDSLINVDLFIGQLDSLKKNYLYPIFSAREISNEDVRVNRSIDPIFDTFEDIINQGNMVNFPELGKQSICVDCYPRHKLK